MSNIPECIKDKYPKDYTIKYLGEMEDGSAYLSQVPLARRGAFVDIVKNNVFIKSFSDLDAVIFLQDNFAAILD